MRPKAELERGCHAKLVGALSSEGGAGGLVKV